jgi:nitrile hydratase subunit beta
MSYIRHADLGGKSGYGAVHPEPEGELFHAPWQARAMALTVAMGATGLWNIDQSRSARETLPNYSHLSYYQIWIAGLEALLRERDLVHPQEIAAAHALYAAPPPPRVLAAASVAEVLARGAPTQRPASVPARFAVGQAVRTRKADPPHHWRLPGYAQGKRGLIERVHGAHVFPDTNSGGLGEQPQWLYTVVFDGTELWSDDAARRTQVSVDAWESYLEAA